MIAKKHINHELAGIFLAIILSGGLAGCEGEPGVMGPMGPAGGTLNLDLGLSVEPLAITVGGNEQATLVVRAHLVDGPAVADVPITLSVSTGAGFCLPGSGATDEQGRFLTEYTPSLTEGVFEITATARYQGLALSRTVRIDQSPSRISGPLLPEGRSWYVAGRWNAESGDILLYDAYQHSMFGVRVDGTPTIAFTTSSSIVNGGFPNPDGSGRILFFDEAVRILDAAGNTMSVIEEPEGFPGSMAAARWCCDGTKILLRSTRTQAGLTSYGVLDPVTGLFDLVEIEQSLIIVDDVPNTAKLLMIRNSRTPVLIDLITGLMEIPFPEHEQELPFSALRDFEVAVKADGSGLLVETDGRLLMAGFEDGRWDTVLDGSLGIVNPMMSPDGEHVLFFSDRTGNGMNLFILDL